MLVSLRVVLGELVFGTPYYDFRFEDSRSRAFSRRGCGRRVCMGEFVGYFDGIHILVLSFIGIHIRDIIWFMPLRVIISYRITYEKEKSVFMSVASVTV